MTTSSKQPSSSRHMVLMPSMFTPELTDRIKDWMEHEPVWIELLYQQIYDGENAPMGILLKQYWDEFNGAMEEHGSPLTTEQDARIELAADRVATYSQLAGFICGLLVGNPGAMVWADLLQQNSGTPDKSRKPAAKKTPKGGQK